MIIDNRGMVDREQRIEKKKSRREGLADRWWVDGGCGYLIIGQSSLDTITYNTIPLVYHDVLRVNCPSQ